MRTWLGRIGITIGAVALTVFFAPSSPASAATASPANVNVDCSPGATATATVTGAVGDTFTVTDTALAGCSLSSYAGVASFSGSAFVSPDLFISSGSSNVLTVTIVGPGTFNVVKGLGGNAGVITIVLGSGGSPGGDEVPYEEGGFDPRPQDLPNTSEGVRAESGLYSATVSWAEPTLPGRQPVILYEVSSSPEDRRCSVAAPSTTCTVTGLRPGLEYTFTVKAHSVIGWGPASSPSNAVRPTGLKPGKPEFLDAALRSGGISVDWNSPVNPTGRPFGYEAQMASCPLPCTAVENLAFKGVDGVDAELSDVTVLYFDKTQPTVFRVRTLSYGVSPSDWAYTVARSDRKLTPVTVTRVFADDEGSLVQWTEDPQNQWWVGGYEVYVSTKATLDGEATPFRLVGTTTGTSLEVGPEASSTPFVRYLVRSLPSDLLKLSLPGARPWDSLASQWRRQTNLVPTPKIIDASFGPRATPGVTVSWEPRAAEGAINVVGFYVQFRNAKTGSWTDRLITTDASGRSANFELTRAETDNVNGVRVRAVAWPGRHWSNWALAVN